MQDNKGRILQTESLETNQIASLELKLKYQTEFQMREDKDLSIKEQQ
jgi:hypothetical protein